MRAVARSALAALFVAPAAHADFTAIEALAQGEFRRLSEDLGAAFAYVAPSPAAPLGVTGFDAGLVVTETDLRQSALFRRAGAGGVSRVLVPKLHVQKGLLAGLDVGAFVGGASDVDARVYGAELRYALLDDGLARPALALRGSATRATGLGPLRVDTAAIDLLASKRFTLLTPYAGAGVVRMRSDVSATSLSGERFNQSRWFGGVALNLLAANLTLEAGKIGDNRSLSAKLGFRF